MVRRKLESNKARSEFFGLGGGGGGSLTGFPANLSIVVTGLYNPNIGNVKISLSKLFTTYGDSITAGNISGVTNSFPYQTMSSLTSGVVDNEGIGSTTSTQIANRVTNVDTTIVQTGLGYTRSQMNAGYVSLEMGRNDTSSIIGTRGILAPMMSNYARSVASLTGPYVILTMPNANIEPAGDPAWAQVTVNADQLVATYPNTVDLKFILQNSGDNSMNDVADLAMDITPRSTRLQSDGTYNSLHPGPAGNAAIKDRFARPWLAAQEGLLSYAMPYQRRSTINGTLASTARNQGGFVTTLPFVGTPSAIVLTGPDAANFSVDSAGNVTNTSGAAPAVSNITYSVAKNGITTQGKQRWYFGAADTSCSDFIFDSTKFLVQPEAPAAYTTQKISGYAIFSCAAGTDGVSMYLLGSEKFGRLTIERNISNRFRVILKADNTGDAAYPTGDLGTSVIVLQSSPTGAGLITASTGMVAVFFSADISLATPVSQIYVNEVSAQAAAVLTQGGTANLGYRRILGAQSQTNATSFLGTLRTLGIYSDYIDWSNAANRAAVYNSSTLAAVNLPSNGAINGIVPTDWFPGNNADRLWGNNRGTSGRYVCAGQSLP